MADTSAASPGIDLSSSVSQGWEEPVSAATTVSLATDQAAKTPSYVQGLRASDREVVTRAMTTGKPVMPNAVSDASHSAVFDAAVQWEAHKVVESSVCGSPGVSSSVATATFATGSIPPLVTALPTAHPKAASLMATDSTLLWMAEQWDAGTATKDGVGSLAHKHQSSLTPEVTTSVFNDADDWAVDAALI
jgi:hypothetical protein